MNAVHEDEMAKLRNYHGLDAKRWFDTLKKIDFHKLTKQDKLQIEVNTFQRTMYGKFDKELSALGASKYYHKKLKENGLLSYYKMISPELGRRDRL